MDSRKSYVNTLWKNLLRKWKESKREPGGGKKSDVSTATGFLMRLASRKKKGCNKKDLKLQRANTLPLIDVPSLLSTDDIAQHDVRLATSHRNSTATSTTFTTNTRARSISTSSSSSSSAATSFTSASSSLSLSRHSTCSANSSPVNKWARRKLSCHEIIFGRRFEQDDSKLKAKVLRGFRSQSVDRRTKFDKDISGKKKTGSAWGFEDDRPPQRTDSTRPTTQLFYNTPPRANMVRSSSTDRQLENLSNFQKLSRKLVVKDKKGTQVARARDRSISLDCGNGRSLKELIRSSYSEDRGAEMMNYLPSSPSAPAFLSFREGFVEGGSSAGNSPQPVRDLRSYAAQKKKGVSIDVSESHTGSKRRADKDKKGLTDLNSLFDAVEQQDMDRVKVILDTSCVDINGLNGESLTALDVAVMTNNIPIAKSLLTRGGKESPLFQRGKSRDHRLETLVADAERKVVDLTALVLNGSAGNANISPAQQKENERQLAHWEFRHRLLKRMKAGYDHARPPDPPSQVELQVASQSSIIVVFDEPQRHNGAVVTRYKVEWSNSESFTPVSGDAIVEDLSHLQFEIGNLSKGVEYFVRVYAWNVKGYGPCAYSSPQFASPSSWREVDSVPSRLEGKLASLHALFHQVQQSRPPEATNMKEMFYRDRESPIQLKKRVSIKNLFVSSPKFQKTIKRGVHMACLLYNDDRVMVTSEDHLPVVEVDESFSGLAIQNDFYWLLKVSCMWEAVRVLKQDMEKTSSASSTLRCKLLQAISSLQTALGIQDLGQFFHRPIRDANGSIIFVVINHIRDTKFVTLSSSKWVTLGKLARRQSLSSLDIGDAQSLLVNTMSEMVLYNQVSCKTLSKGLYLGYVKLQTSVDVLRVMVPNKTPSCIPYVKIKDCPNVSREEWEWLCQAESGILASSLTPVQNKFKHLLSEASKKLFRQLGLLDSSISTHRIYDLEVLELSPTVSMILILPSIEDICIVPGHSDTLAKRVDYTFLPVQVFESIHMNAYLPDFFTLYAKLSAIVEMDGILSQQGHREAFSSEEISKAKEQVEVTSHLQTNLDRVWQCARWIRDITTYARNREKKSGIQMAHVVSMCSIETSNTVHNSNNNNGIPHSSTISSSNRSSNTTGPYANGENSGQAAASSPSNKLPRATGGGSGVGLPNAKTIGVIKERRIAKFFDPNEETPHSVDSIRVGGHSIVRRTSSSNSSESSTSGVCQAKSVPASPVTSPVTSPVGRSQVASQRRLSSSSSLSSISTVASSSSSSSSSNTANSNSDTSPWGIIKVHAMYETGLSKNVNMKLHITEQTSSRDIINLVVRHLNSLATEKSRSVVVYPEEQLSEFCLLLQYQGQRSVLSDDFKLLQLRGHLKKASVCVTRLDKAIPIESKSKKENRNTTETEEDDVDDDLLHGRATLV